MLGRASTFGGVSAAACALAAWWAFRPLPMPRLEASFSAPTPEESVPRLQRPAVDLAAFSAPLWVAPPAPPATPPITDPPKPLPPLRVQVLAIVVDAEDIGHEPEFSVLIYDPDADRVLSLRSGDQVAGRTIARITRSTVEFRERDRTRTMALHEAAPNSKPPSGGPAGGGAR